ncbi:hypothetical protein N7465_001286 [Penicillium sp. CMV-2018d]|nr:hypothetical protein N7465_001286 [Penicillium sp. CMV-2018d]
MPPLVVELGRICEDASDKGVAIGEYRDKWDAVGPYDDWVAHRPPVGVYVSGTVEFGWPFAVAVPGGDVILTIRKI